MSLDGFLDYEQTDGVCERDTMLIITCTMCRQWWRLGERPRCTCAVFTWESHRVPLR